MDINDKKFIRIKRVVNWIITIVLAGFLIALSSIVIDDLDGTVAYPRRADFEDTILQKEFESQRDDINRQLGVLNESMANIKQMIDVAVRNKDAEQESFDNWIKTRSTLGKADQDPEVMQRIAKIDHYKEVVLSWQTQQDSIQTLKNPLFTKLDQVWEKDNEESKRVDKIYYKAYENYNLKVFLIRLLFAGPILALGIFFFLRRRNHKFSPLYMGFSLFSVYVFFVGLVPYLPSYGGYVRYTVGLIVTLGLGYYAIKHFRAYQERKAIELKASTEERANRLEGERAEKAFNNHICPSCGKDFLLQPWETYNTDNKIVKAVVASNFCRHCGMQLIKKCSHCNQNNYAHLPFCINCGESIK